MNPKIVNVMSLVRRKNVSSHKKTLKLRVRGLLKGIIRRLTVLRDAFSPRSGKPQLIPVPVRAR